MAYSALDVAKYVINYEIDQGRKVTNLRLQKLLYFVQAKVLMETENPCFDDVMEAWEYGPVVPAVYHAYAEYRNFSIQKQETVIDIAQDIKNFINDILNYFANTETFELVQITHCQKPWIEARAKGNRQPISIDTIREYFNN